MVLHHRPATANLRWSVGAPQAVAMRSLRSLTWLPVGAMGTLLVLALFAPVLIERVALPVAVLGALLGLPHGAVDHLVPWWWGSSAQRLSPTTLAGFAAAYAVAALFGLALLLAAPTPTLLVFLVLSAAHFGWGDVVTSAERAGRPSPRLAQEWPVAAAHGLVVVGLLLWARPGSVEPYLRPLSGWLADFAYRGQAPGLAAVACFGGLALILLFRAHRRWEAIEYFLLLATFSVAPPLAAFGIYFGGWHAVRHAGRLLDLARNRQLHTDRATDWRSAAGLLAKAAAWPTLIALSGVAALWLGRNLASLQAEIAILLALTFPHAAVIYALDRHSASGPTRQLN